MADYLADPCPEPSASAGVLRILIDRTPLHAMLEHPRLGGKRDEWSRSTALGSVVHALLLGKGAAYEVLDPKEYPNKDGKTPQKINAALKEAMDAAAKDGVTPIMLPDFDVARRMVDAAVRQIRHHDIGDIFNEPGQAEVTMAWLEGDTWCRAAIDWLPDDLHAQYNLKTSTSAHPDHFERRAMQLGYDFGAAHYEAGAEILFGQPVQTRFIVIETEPPYGLTVVELDGASRVFARRKRDAALRLWATCLRANDWPCYPSRVATVGLPQWHLFRQEEADVEGKWKPEMLKWMNDFYSGEAAE